MGGTIRLLFIAIRQNSSVTTALDDRTIILRSFQTFVLVRFVTLSIAFLMLKMVVELFYDSFVAFGLVGLSCNTFRVKLNQTC
jgi:hypothetical protein